MDDILKKYLIKTHENKYGKINIPKIDVKKKGYDAVVSIVGNNSDNDKIIVNKEIKKKK